MAFWKGSSRPKSLAGMHQEVSEIKSLPLTEAKRRVIAALQDPTRFECVRDPAVETASDDLPNSVREIFSIYSSVKAVAGEAILSRENLGPSSYRSGFIRIGTNLDATELAVRPCEEPVYEIDGSDADEQELDQGGIPSVYHWILVTEEVLYGQ